MSRSLESEYATEYRTTAEKVIKYIGRKSERTLIAEINKLAAALKEAGQ